MTSSPSRAPGILGMRERGYAMIVSPITQPSARSRIWVPFTPGLFGATVQGTLKGLPWLSVLALSATVAYAMTVAAGGVPFAGDAQTTISAVQAPAHALVAAGADGSSTSTAAVEGAGSDEACDTTGGDCRTSA
jgi:hypothetical protein